MELSDRNTSEAVNATRRIFTWPFQRRGGNSYAGKKREKKKPNFSCTHGWKSTCLWAADVCWTQPLLCVLGFFLSSVWFRARWSMLRGRAGHRARINAANAADESVVFSRLRRICIDDMLRGKLQRLHLVKWRCTETTIVAWKQNRTKKKHLIFKLRSNPITFVSVRRFQQQTFNNGVYKFIHKCTRAFQRGFFFGGGGRSFRRSTERRRVSVWLPTSKSQTKILLRWTKWRSRQMIHFCNTYLYFCAKKKKRFDSTFICKCVDDTPNIFTQTIRHYVFSPPKLTGQVFSFVRLFVCLAYCRYHRMWHVLSTTVLTRNSLYE